MLMYHWKRFIARSIISIAAVLLCGCATGNPFLASAGERSGIAGQLVQTKAEGGALHVTRTATGRVKVDNAAKTELVAEVDTDSSGGFSVPLHPGTYFVYTEIPGFGLYGREVEVEPHRVHHIRLYLPPK